jgi:hypothetical protein
MTKTRYKIHFRLSPATRSMGTITYGRRARIPDGTCNVGRRDEGGGRHSTMNTHVRRDRHNA